MLKWCDLRFELQDPDQRKMLSNLSFLEDGGKKECAVLRGRVYEGCEFFVGCEVDGRQPGMMKEGAVGSIFTIPASRTSQHVP